MKKLIDLKEWLTLEESARYLTQSIAQEISVADVLRLALDGQLKLSLNIVNHAKAKCGVIGGPEVRVWETFGHDEETKNRIMVSERLGKDRYVNFSEEAETIFGIWDLPMIGNERIDIEHRFQQLVGGPPVVLEHAIGTLIEKDGLMAQLQEGWVVRDPSGYDSTDDEPKAASRIIVDNESPASSFEEVGGSDKTDYFQSSRLPNDALVVVKKGSLIDFESSMVTSAPKMVDGELPELERNSTLKLILGMAIAKYGYEVDATKNKATGSKHGSIKADLELLGLDLDQGTIRKFLEQASERFGSIIKN